MNGKPFLSIGRVVSRPGPYVEAVVGPVEGGQLGAHVHPLLAQLPTLYISISQCKLGTRFHKAG